jgi:hypothetical protein
LKRLGELTGDEPPATLVEAWSATAPAFYKVGQREEARANLVKAAATAEKIETTQGRGLALAKLAAAQHGIDARLYWPGLGEVTTSELVLRKLLPMAYDGLSSWGVAAEVRDRFLGVIEGRAKTGRNGAAWQVATVGALQARGLDRPRALAEMLHLYCERMHSNEPVHTWDGPE